MKGVEAENYIKTAREEIAKTLKVKDKEILFTSGGTESNNMALIGHGACKQARRKPHHYLLRGTCVHLQYDSIS